MSAPGETIAQEGPYAPTVFVVADMRPLWMTPEAWAAQGVTEAMLWDHWAQDEPLPPTVPLPDSFYMLAGTLLVAWAALWMARRQA